MNKQEVLEVLQEFWAAGVDDVSPGALGMLWAGWPLLEAEAVQVCAGLPVEFVGGWIRRRP